MHKQKCTYRGVLKVVETVISKNEPPPFPGLHTATFTTRGSITLIGMLAPAFRVTKGSPQRQLHYAEATFAKH